ncbi:MAG: ferrochelatase [Cellvibrionaceae bacterium]|nr:ferrochelatase [Cellvibrionaceae bacterium]
MPYIGRGDFSHQQSAKIGVLITNLGTPKAPTAAALRAYLAEFLADPRVVEFPRLLWKAILHGIILRVRPRRSARSYATIWTQEGSPLLVHTQQQAQALGQALRNDYGEQLQVDFAMRYGTPSISEKLQQMQQAGVRQLLVLPLYPQYSAATSASTFDALAQDFMRRRWLPDLRFISHYHDQPGYIDAIVQSINTHQATHGTADRLLFSYHGIPLRYLKNGDPYHCECYKTTRLVAEKLNLEEQHYMTTFQSRFGREPWLQPYTDVTLQSLAAQGVKSVQIICPGFAADCLETLEEIAIENRQYFIAAGGQQYSYIPALNAEQAHIDFLAQLIKTHLQGWTIPDKNAAKLTETYYRQQLQAQNQRG